MDILNQPILHRKKMSFLKNFVFMQLQYRSRIRWLIYIFLQNTILYIHRPIILEKGKKYCSNITIPKSSDCSVASGNIPIFNTSIDIETFQEPYVELLISEASVFIDDQNETECGM